jgi:hypothetical protein
MNNDNKIVFRKCSDPLCERSVKEASRSICWHCTNLKKRYGVTHSGVLELRREAGTLCYICEKTRKYLTPFGNREYRLCSRCLYLCQTMGDEGWMRRLREVLAN